MGGVCKLRWVFALLFSLPHQQDLQHALTASQKLLKIANGLCQALFIIPAILGDKG